MAEEKVSPTEKETKQAQWEALATQIGDKHDADVLLFSGEIAADSADELIVLAKRPARRKNVILLLTTRGGSPDAAFRMARCLQTHYTKLTLHIHGMCKSAGTLLAVGVDEIVLSDFGEFGPLDIQLGKKDELFESTSGLDITQALTSLNLRTFRYFTDALMGIRRGTKGQISTKLAAEIASKLAVGVYSHIYNQIDPVQLGSVERAMRIVAEYGRLLSKNRQNLQKDAIEKLATGYPSHGFVIDLEEAKTLFKLVRQPTDDEEQLGACISFITRDETDDSYVHILNEQQPTKPLAGPHQEDDHEPIPPAGPGTEGERAERGANHRASHSTPLPANPGTISTPTVRRQGSPA